MPVVRLEGELEPAKVWPPISGNFSSVTDDDDDCDGYDNDGYYAD